MAEISLFVGTLKVFNINKIYVDLIHCYFLQSGYLIKRARESGRNFKKRWFIVTDNTLTYFESQDTITKPKGNILLVDDTLISDENVPGYKYGFKVTTPFESITLVAADEAERMAWKVAIIKALELVQNALRGYMLRKGLDGEKDVRKFFVFRNKVLYIHRDHLSTLKSELSLPMGIGSKCEMNEQTKELTYIDAHHKKVVLIFESRNDHEMRIWYEAACIQIAKATAEKKVNEVKENLNNATLRSILGMKPPGDAPWRSMYVSLIKDEVVIMQVNAEGEPLGVVNIFKIDAHTKISETSLRPNAFEIVNSDRIIHLCAKSREAMEEWFSHIKPLIPEKKVTVITVREENGEVHEEIVPEEVDEESNVLSDDILHLDALALIPKDVFYQVSFKENKAIGIVLERAGEWAMTKIADFKETGIRPGSALTFVNKDTVIFDEYDNTISRFKDWKPPLKLVFRQAPSKFGYLTKKSSTPGGKWRKYYYLLMDGKLAYKSSDDEKEKKIGEYSLVGGYVSFVSEREAGKKFCFKFISGSKCLVLHATSQQHMREWAAILYHAIAIANGGKHIIEYERERMKSDVAKEKALEKLEVESDNAYIVEMINASLANESAEELTQALQLAEAASLSGDFIDYSTDVLQKLLETKAAYQQSEIEPIHLGDQSAPAVIEEDEDVIHGEAVLEEEVVPESETVDLMAEEIEENQGSQWGPPATYEQLKQFFKFYAKRTEDGLVFINVMLFSTIWRMITGERGNLFKEMQMFNKYVILCLLIFNNCFTSNMM